MTKITDRIIRWPEVKARTGLSRTTAWREMRAGRFPSAVRLTNQIVGWRETEIDRCVESRATRNGSSVPR
ncbi:MAG TPA: AlpA family phage regulatory protein [Beijerinckiaceae bacterium]|nr:AlpA family phage regulatory protein [Beijerinckiaceae bacterium]